MIGTKVPLRRRLLAWYRRHRRDLPWRVAPDAPAGARPDPYRVLVSEAMLQQTQVPTVIPYFVRFIRQFPTIHELAAADEQEVLRLWQGLGYYSRARHLRATAQVVVRELGGVIPQEPQRLLRLPGVGRYTAGAIASLAFDRPAAVVDGNVARVLCRLDSIASNPRDKTTLERLWRRAEQLLDPAAPGDFNSALMELGATVCTARSPRCPRCPIRAHCQALAAGAQQHLPAPRRTRTIPLLRRRTLCIRRLTQHAQPQWLIEQRPAHGRWAGMWQFITRPGRSVALPPGVMRSRKLGTLSHVLSHRRYRFDVYVCDLRGRQAVLQAVEAGAAAMRWVRLSDLDQYPLPRPHLRIAQMLREECTGAAGGRARSGSGVQP